MFDAQLGRLVEVADVELDGTIGIARGRAVDGATIRFVGERRALAAMAQEIAEGRRVVADVPDWAVLSVASSTAGD